MAWISFLHFGRGTGTCSIDLDRQESEAKGQLLQRSIEFAMCLAPQFSETVSWHGRTSDSFSVRIFGFRVGLISSSLEE